MANKKSSSGGFKGLLGSLMGLILAGTFLFAVGKASGASTWYEAAQLGAARIQSWVTSNEFDPEAILKKIPSPDGEPSGTSSSSKTESSVTSSAAIKTLDSIKIANASTATYNRNDWKHWINAGSSCWNVREEVLYQQGTEVVLLDKTKTKTTDKKKACAIQSGSWVDPYTGKTFTDPSKLDIDHVIPLGYTHRQGGSAWSASKKQDYANSLNPGHLLAVSASANRAKSDNGPSKWMPSNKAHTCSYAKNWVTVANKWGLTLTKADATTLRNTLKSC